MSNKKIILIILLNGIHAFIGCTCDEHSHSRTTKTSQASTSVSTSSRTSNSNNEYNSHQENNNQDGHFITKLTYTINLSQKDDQGNYLAKLGEPIIIQAQAIGPHQSQAKWLVDKVSKSVNINFHGDLMEGEQVYQKNITDEIKFTTKAFSNHGSGSIKLTCHPVLEKDNDESLYEGTQEFDIMVQ